MSDSGPDWGLARFLAWMLVLVGFEVLAGAIGMFAGPPLGVLLGGIFLIGWAFISLAVSRGK